MHGFLHVPVTHTLPVWHAKNPPFACTPHGWPVVATSAGHAQTPLVPPWSRHAVQVPGACGLHAVWHAPARHDAPLRQGVPALHGWQSAAPVCAMQTLSGVPVTCAQTLPLLQAGFGQLVHVAPPPVPPQQLRQKACCSVPMQMPHASQMPAVSQRSPGLPVGSHRPFRHAKPTGQVDCPVPVHWLVQLAVGAQRPPPDVATHEYAGPQDAAEVHDAEQKKWPAPSVAQTPVLQSEPAVQNLQRSGGPTCGKHAWAGVPCAF